MSVLSRVHLCMSPLTLCMHVCVSFAVLVYTCASICRCLYIHAVHSCADAVHVLFIIIWTY